MKVSRKILLILVLFISLTRAARIQESRETKKYALPFGVTREESPLPAEDESTGRIFHMPFIHKKKLLLTKKLLLLKLKHFLPFKLSHFIWRSELNPEEDAPIIADIPETNQEGIRVIHLDTPGEGPVLKTYRIPSELLEGSRPDLEDDNEDAKEADSEKTGTITRKLTRADIDGPAIVLYIVPKNQGEKSLSPIAVMRKP